MARMNQRKTLGLSLLGVGFVAFAVVPGLHLLDHHDDHEHVGGSIVFHQHHPPARTPGPEDPHAPPPGGEDSDTHGAGTLSHLGLSTLRGDPPDPVKAPVIVEETVIVPPGNRTGRAPLVPHRARAPPI